MFGFSRRKMKLGRLKVQLADSTQGTKSPIRHAKRPSNTNGENVVLASGNSGNSDELNCQCSSTGADLNNCTTAKSENWMVLSTAGDVPVPRSSHAATVIGSKMVVVGGESGRKLLEDVQVLNFDKLTWTTGAPKVYLSPSSLPLKVPACKGHCLVTWGKKALLVGGKTDPASDKFSVWAFDIDTECWSHVEAKGEIPAVRSGHTVIRAGTILILFGGEDAKGKKLNDLHMFDLKSLMWLPLHYTGTGPSPRSNHAAALHDDRTLLIFGGASKSRILNDLYSLDFETMVWSRIKIKGFHPSPRAGCRGVLCGSKWYIAGGGSRKKRHAETLVYDILKFEWSVAARPPPSSVTTNKGFSLVVVHHKDKVFLVAYGGNKKEPSNQVEVLMMVKNEQSLGLRSALDKDLLPFENCSTIISESSVQPNNGAPPCPVHSVARHNMASVVEHHGSGRKSLSESSVEPNSVCGNVSLRKQFHEEECNSAHKMQKNLEEERYKELDDGSILKNSSQAMDLRSKLLETGSQMDIAGSLANAEDNPLDDIILPETDGKSAGLTASSNIYQLYEAKMAALQRRNGLLEGQLAAAVASREAAEKNLSSVIKSRQDTDRKLADTVKEMEMLKEKLTGFELAQEEANSLSNIVHSDNVRLEHDVAFLKAVLDDTQKELHSTRGVLSGERARAFQLQVEVFHLKQRLQSLENRAPTPRKPFQM